MVADVGAHEAVVVEVDLVLLLRAPLLVVEDTGDDGEVFLDRGHDLVQAHAPRAVADDRAQGVQGPRLWRRGRPGTRSRSCRNRAPAGTSAGLEAHVGVRHRADVADVGGDDGVVGQGRGQLLQRAARADRCGSDEEIESSSSAQAFLAPVMPRTCRVRLRSPSLTARRSAIAFGAALASPMMPISMGRCGRSGRGRCRPGRSSRASASSPSLLGQGAEAAQTGADGEDDVGFGIRRMAALEPW